MTGLAMHSHPPKKATANRPPANSARNAEFRPQLCIPDFGLTYFTANNALPVFPESHLPDNRSKLSPRQNGRDCCCNKIGALDRHRA